MQSSHPETVLAVNKITCIDNNSIHPYKRYSSHDYVHSRCSQQTISHQPKLIVYRNYPPFRFHNYFHCCCIVTQLHTDLSKHQKLGKPALGVYKGVNPYPLPHSSPAPSASQLLSLPAPQPVSSPAPQISSSPAFQFPSFPVPQLSSSPASQLPSTPASQLPPSIAS